MANVGFETLNGTAASETLTAVIRYDANSDSYYIQNTIYGYDGDDTLNALANGSTMIAGQTYAWNSTLIGGNGDDTLLGGAVRDVLDGGAGNDTLIGGQGNDYLIGGRGNDTFDGTSIGQDFDIVGYDRDGGSLGVVVNLATGTGTDTFGDIDTYIMMESVFGTSHADQLTGGNPANDYIETFAGLAGDDIIDGGSGYDLARYDQDASHGGTAGVVVNLGAGSATDGFGNHDTLISIEGVEGTAFADQLTGGNAANSYEGRYEDFGGLAGDDIIDGGSGYDEARYDYDAFNGGTAGAVVDLGAGTATDGFGDHDTLINIEGVRGTAFVDTFTGSSGDDRFAGLAGDDIIDGGLGCDTVRYDQDWLYGGTAGVVVDLGAGTATDGFGDHDTLISIEGAQGTAFADTLIGGSGDNQLSGLDGNDLLSGGHGNDHLSGGTGFDTLVGGDGNDDLDGGANPSNQGDIMLGGAGDDTYHVDSSLDLVDEGFVFPDAGWGGTDTVISTSNWYWDVESVGEIDRISEDASDPDHAGVTFVGGVFDNTLIGHKGTDILFGRGGNDTYIPGDGVDWISLSTLGLTDQNAYAGVDGHNTIIATPRTSGPSSYDIMFEFDPARDKVDVSAYHQYATGADVLSHAVDDGAGNSFVALGDGLDYLYFVGLTKDHLLASDFAV